MLHLTDDDVERLLGATSVAPVLRDAFVDLAGGAAAQQLRVRTEAGGAKLSTLGAVVPRQGVLGAKVYSTIDGRFNFLIVLFSAQTGLPLATLAANAITRRRTAAVSLLAAQAAGARGREIVVFGAGVQGQAHAQAFAVAYPSARVRVIDRRDEVDVQDALAHADIVITATRSPTPLFAGDWIAPGAVVCAVGSSRPDTREVDDRLLARAATVIVESRAQTLREAGDLVLADPNVRDGLRLVELAHVLSGQAAPRARETDIVLFKSVGVGIADVAVAGLVHRLATGA
jgi:ornithine cyclodeaminase